MAVKASTQVSLVDITDAYNVILTSESYTFMGDSVGAPSGLSCTTQVVAYCGGSPCKVTVGNIICPSEITASVTSNGSVSPTITFRTTATVTASCEATIPVNVDGVTVNKKFSFAVAKTGATGATGKTALQPKKNWNGTYTTVGQTATASTGNFNRTPVVGDTFTNLDGSSNTGTWQVTAVSGTNVTIKLLSYVNSKGQKGDTGKGISSTAITYQASSSGTTVPTGTWQSSIPSVSAGQYLWTRTVITYSDNTTSTSYSVGRMGTNGSNGSAGKGISSTSITYQAGASGTVVPTGTWSSSVPATSASAPYLWTRTIFTYTDNTTSTSYSVGSTPEGISVGGRNLARATSADYTAPYTNFNGNPNICPTVGRVYTKGLNAGDIITVRIVYKYTNIVAASGKTASCRLQGSGNVTEWNSGTFPSGTSGMNISGSGEKEIVYQAKIDADMVKNDHWNVNIRHNYVQSGSVQWKEFKVEKGNIATDWTPAPEDSIASVDVEYYLSTSATSLSGGSWSTAAPAWVNGKYMWSRTVTTDGAGNKTYSPNQNGVCIAGAQGATGAKGEKGDTGGTGKGVKSIVEQYYKSTSATSQTGGSWSTTYPGWENGKYIWTRSVITYSDNTTSTTTAVCVSGMKGDTGAKGDQGIQGPKGDAGADGESIAILITNYSYTQNEIGAYSQNGYSGTWRVTSSTGVKIGDSVLLRVMNKTKNGYCYIIGKVTNVPSSTAVTVTSVGLLDKGESGESDIKCYPLAGGTNQIVWSKLGTLTSAGDNSNFIINVYTGNGYSGNAYQNSQAEIVIKDGWQSSASTTSAFGVSVTRQNCDNLKVQVRATASNKCDVWVYLPWSYSWGTYAISGTYTSWESSETTQTAEPTTGTLQDLEYRINSENAAKTATNFMEFNSGTGLQIGDKTNGTWKGFRSRITSEAFEILNEVGTAVASYGRKLIQLGKDATDAVIELCGGKGIIKYFQIGVYGETKPTLSLLSENLGLIADDTVIIKSEQMDDDDTTYTSQIYLRKGHIDIATFTELNDGTVTGNNGISIDDQFGIDVSFAASNKETLSKIRLNGWTLLDYIHPVGSIYLAYNDSESPAEKFGGEWEQITGKFLYCDTGTASGGSTKHKHVQTVGLDYASGYLYANSGNRVTGTRVVTGQMCAYKYDSYGASASTREDSTYESYHTPQYITVYAWRRTA